MAGDFDSRVRSLAPLPIRAHPLVLGTVLFLSSELMFFAALFAAYFDLREKATAWPPPGVRLDVAGSTVGTVLLFFASVAMIFASRAVDRGRFEASRWWTTTALAAALGFAVLALHGYAQENVRHRHKCVRLHLLHADRLSSAPRARRRRHIDRDTRRHTEPRPARRPSRGLRVNDVLLAFRLRRLARNLGDGVLFEMTRARAILVAIVLVAAGLASAAFALPTPPTQAGF